MPNRLMAQISSFSNKFHLSIYIPIELFDKKTDCRVYLEPQNYNTLFSKVMTSKEIPLSLPFQASRYLWFKTLTSGLSLRI